MNPPRMTELDFLLRDLRHLGARAASDLADWLVYLDLEGKADRTLYQYVRKLAPLLREFPDKEIGEFTASDVSLILARVPKRSRHIARSIINRFFLWAEEQDRIEHSPMSKVPRVKNPQRRHRDIFTNPEIALLENLPTPDGSLFSILFETGIRRAEARYLRREHVDLDRQRLIVVGGKGGKDRIIPLTPGVIQAVANLDLLERLQREDYFWYTKPGGGRRTSHRFAIGSSTFERWYRICIDAAGVRYLSPHTTRHTYSDLMRRAGLDLEERQLVLGHASIRTTADIYGHVSIDDVIAKVSAFDLGSET